MNTSTLNILNAESLDYSSAAREIVSGVGDLQESDLSRSELLGSLEKVDVLIVRLRNQINREVIDAAPRLKIIITATTGLDHIDMSYAAEKGILVLSLKGEIDFLRSIPATAEHTWGLLLALIRHLPWAYQSVLLGQWDRNRFRGRDLAGRTLGIVGLGRIGEKIAHYGQAFGMNVIAYDPYRKDWISTVERISSLKELCQKSEIFTLHVPLNPETKNLIGAQEISWLSSEAVLINTARGAVLKEAALLEALQNRRLAGAALDVISDETQSNRLTTNSLIDYARSHQNLLLSPHIGGATIDSMHATEIFMANKLVQTVKSIPFDRRPEAKR